VASKSSSRKHINATKSYLLGKYLSFAFNPCRLENLCREVILIQHLPGTLLWRNKSNNSLDWACSPCSKSTSSVRPKAKWCGFTVLPKLTALQTYQPMVLFWFDFLDVGFSAIWDVWDYHTCQAVVTSDSFLWLPLDFFKVIGCLLCEQLIDIESKKHRMAWVEKDHNDHLVSTYLWCLRVHLLFILLSGAKSIAMHCQCMSVWRQGTVCLLRFSNLLFLDAWSSSPWSCIWSKHVIYVFGLLMFLTLHRKKFLLSVLPRGVGIFSTSFGS